MASPKNSFDSGSEQQSASALQNGGDLGHQSALDSRVQQKEKAHGDHSIKSSTEEVRILYGCTLKRGRPESGLGTL